MTSQQLIVACARAIEQNDVYTAQQVVSALLQISSVKGDPGERVTAYFLRALLRRSGSLLNSEFLSAANLAISQEVQWMERRWSLNELTRFVDLTPFFRFGLTAANGAMLEAFRNYEQIHVVDFSTTYGVQWPTLIAALADRPGGPPSSFRLTLSSAFLPFAPRLLASYEEIGHRLGMFARLQNVPFEFRVLAAPLESLSARDFDLRHGEALGVNFSLRLHYLADETGTRPSPTSSFSWPLCPRDALLHTVRSLNPVIVTLYEEDCEATNPDVVKRVESSLAYEWMPFDFVATFWSPGNRERQEFEENVGRKIENIVACEGDERIERSESKRQWVQRMMRLRFRAEPVTDDVVSALLDVVDHHRTGWSMRHLDLEGTQSLLWKGNSLAFASAWTPAG